MSVSVPEFFWEDLVQYIAESRVIPVVGGSLLRYGAGEGSITLEELLARRLEEQLKVQVPSGASLSDVVAEYMRAGGRREAIYPRVKAILDREQLPVPPALAALAAIPGFRLFVSLTFDGLLTRALDEARHAGEPRTLRLAFSPNQQQDLPAEADFLDKPAEAPVTVFQLMGRASSSPTYAVTEEDLLEFFCCLQDQARRPRRLFDALRHHHLLFLGVEFQDWLARLLVRLARGDRLSMPRDCREVFVDHGRASHEPFVMFLRSYSASTEVVTVPSAEAFVLELQRQFAALAGRPRPSEQLAAKAAAEPMPDGAIYISCAREDLPRAEALRAALDAAGLDAWFDRAKGAGDPAHEVALQRNIGRASLFLPLISAHTGGRLEGLFRLEWRHAIARADRMHESRPFILPARIDDTPAEAAGVPAHFYDLEWAGAPGGVPDAGLIARLRDAVRQIRRAERAAA